MQFRDLKKQYQVLKKPMDEAISKVLEASNYISGSQVAELEEKLAAPGKEKMLEECLGIANMANIYFVRQKQTLGLGHAVSVAKALY